MASRVIDSDRGYRELLRGLAQLGEPAVYVGILQDKGVLRERRDYKRTKAGAVAKRKKRVAVADPEAITLVEIATINEFGSSDGRVPERSFMRSTVDANEATYQRQLDKVAGATVDAMVEGGVAAGEAAMRKGLGRLGLRVERDVKDMIRDLRDPPNAPATLARKFPGDNPLIDSGRMRQSISFRVEVGKGEGGGS